MVNIYLVPFWGKYVSVYGLVDIWQNCAGYLHICKEENRRRSELRQDFQMQQICK